MSNFRPPVVTVDAIPQVALDSMNHTHQEEVELINRFAELLVADSPDEGAITTLFDEWLEHTRDHFDRENRLMQEYDFPAYPVHSGEHERVLAQLESLRQEWYQNKQVEPVANFIFVDWPAWFDQHVNSMDMVTAQFISHKVA